MKVTPAVQTPTGFTEPGIDTVAPIVRRGSGALFGDSDAYLAAGGVTAAARDGVREFAFVCLPLKLRGGTGSPVRPIALV